MSILVKESVVIKRPLVLEIVGPAGAGKTTIVQAFHQRFNEIEVGVNPAKSIYLLYCIHIFFTFIPIYLRYFRHSRFFTMAEMRSMVYLKAWQAFIKRQKPEFGKWILLDHGPIFRLALLGEFGPEMISSDMYQCWLNGMLSQWREILHVIIWVDAPNDVLTNRIDTRNRRHRVKQQPRDIVYQFLNRYRTAYRRIIDKMNNDNRIFILEFDTDKENVDQIVEKILAVLAEDWKSPLNVGRK